MVVQRQHTADVESESADYPDRAKPFLDYGLIDTPGVGSRIDLMDLPKRSETLLMYSAFALLDLRAGV